MNIWHSMEGQVGVDLVTADPSGALEAIVQAGIPITGILPEGELTLSFQIRRIHLSKLSELALRRGEKLTIQREWGVYYLFRRFIRRRILLMGLCVLFLLVLLLPQRVLFLTVSGNDIVPSQKILEEAAAQGLCFGASRENVRSERIKNGLLAAIPELKWVGVNTYGCVAQITVAEKQAEQDIQLPHSGIGHLISGWDGIVEDITVTNGTALCRPGQAVSKGQILISGFMDCGIVQKGTIAQGEVTAVTRRKFTAVTPNFCFVRSASQKKQVQWSLILGKKRIKLWIGSGIWDSRCGRIYKEYPLTLPGGFQLPVSLAADERSFSSAVREPIPEAEVKDQISAFAEAYLRETMLAGVVCQRQEHLTQSGGCFQLEGDYLCREVISRRKWEQIGDTNE